MELVEFYNAKRQPCSIKSFTIIGLFGNRDIVIPFDRPVNIFVGENGLGKTTILNTLYYTLTGNFRRLNSIEFDYVKLEFKSDTVISISKDDLLYVQDEEEQYSPGVERAMMYIRQTLSGETLNKLRREAGAGRKKASEKFRLVLDELQNELSIPAVYLQRALSKLVFSRLDKIQEVREIINKELKEEIIYFPTYRRIEEELQNLGSGEFEADKGDKRLIQFGMEDVSKALSSLLKKIKDSSYDGYSAITGTMLRQYVEGLPDITNAKQKIRIDILKIVLERIGNNITEEYKERIIKLVKTNEIFEEEKYKYLINFLLNLIHIYDQQMTLDISIKTFASVCNGYLKGKSFLYDESKVTLNVYDDITGREIKLRYLSSGEKQIISLFTKIYFNSSKKLLVLFDEPELSLSLPWQKKLLPDIFRSKKCNLLLTVTHSPFIFDNDFDIYARDMATFVTIGLGEN